MQFVYIKILYICTGDIRDIMTNVYMAALHSRIDHMGPPPSLGGNPFAGSCCAPASQSFCGFSSPRIGMALAGSFYNAPMMGFGGFGYSSSMSSLFAIATATAMASSALATRPSVGTFGSLTMPQVATPTFQFQPATYNYTLPTFSFPTFSSFSYPTFNFSLPTDYKFNFSGYSSNPFGTTETYNSSSSSKIKPGLLKGNLKGKEAVITQLCEKYNVDVALALSIIGQESGFGTSNLAKHNNFMGYRAAGDAGKSPKGFGYFSTPEKGLEAAIKNLSKYPEKYASKGIRKADMNNIDAIAQVYCEGNSYSSSIKNIYNKTVKSYLA